MDDLGADSLDTVELVMALEEEFECEIPDDQAEKITTVQQAVDYILANKEVSQFRFDPGKAGHHGRPCYICFRSAYLGTSQSRHHWPGPDFPGRQQRRRGLANIIAGVSGIAPVTRFDTSTFPVQFAGEVKNFDITQYISARMPGAWIDSSITAWQPGIQAVRDAGLDQEGAADPERVGVAIGSGIGGLPLIEETKDDTTPPAYARYRRSSFPASIINMISGNLSIEFGFKGPNLSIVTACTTGTHSIGEAARIIEYGDADVMVAGGAESTVSPLGMGVSAARALSPVMTIQQRPAARGTRIATVSSWARGWCPGPGRI